MKTAEHERKAGAIKYALRLLALIILVTTFVAAFVPGTSANDGAPRLEI